MLDPAQFELWCAQLDQGGEAARQAKGEICERTWELTSDRARAKLHQTPWVRRWEETDDLHSSLNLRLLDILDKGHRPRSDRHLIGLAAQVVGRLLIDSSRKLYGPEGLGRNHATDAGQGVDDTTHAGPMANAVDRNDSVVDLSMCAEFHEWIRALPEDDRELFEMMYYLAMKEEDVAHVMNCSSKTVHRRWRRLKERLADAVKDHWPGIPSPTDCPSEAAGSGS
jgi:RNA polymerase sigma factor (sigma-70 family)